MLFISSVYIRAQAASDLFTGLERFHHADGLIHYLIGHVIQQVLLKMGAEQDVVADISSHLAQCGLSYVLVQLSISLS